jgi:mevalonate kinase
MANVKAALLQPRTTFSHGTQTPEHSPVDTMRSQLEPELPTISTPATNGTPALRRKQSSPMMPPFMVSAPGKVIVYGEHAVVHGKVQPDERNCETYLTFL